MFIWILEWPGNNQNTPLPTSFDLHPSVSYPKRPEPSSDIYKFLPTPAFFHRQIEQKALSEVFLQTLVPVRRISSITKSTMALIPSFFGSRRSNIFDPFSLDVWDPFDGFPSSALSNMSTSACETSQFANTRIDWKETPEAHVFRADLPGIKKEEVKVEVEVEEGRILQISGERSKEQEEKNDKWHRMERSTGKFLRRFRLPENAKTDQVKASMENGVLTVTVPKEEEKKPEVKAIEISG